MAIRVVRLGTERAKGEGLRIGTVRRPPRGVPKGEFAARDFYDVWLPQLSPSAELVTRALAAKTEHEWTSFVKAYRREMNAPDAARLLELLAALSASTEMFLSLTVTASDAGLSRAPLHVGHGTSRM